MSGGHPFFWFAIGACIILVSYLTVAGFSTANEKLIAANNNYLAGEEAKTIGDRQNGFNTSLAIYKELETEYAPTSGNGKLYYNMGNSYFQLGAYPMAILYYERAKNLMPRDIRVKTNLKIAKEKLNIKNKETDSLLNKLFFFQNKLSIPEQLSLLFGCTLLLFLLGSLLIWAPLPLLKSLIVAASVALLFILIHLFYAQFIVPSSAIALKSSYLYMDGGLQYAKVQDNPLPAGTKVQVLGVINGGKWIKAKTEEGITGYLPGDSAQII